MIELTTLHNLIEDGDAGKLAVYMKENNLELVDNKIVAKSEVIKSNIEYWDKRQLVRKILLNSAYGALLNKHCRYYDLRIGQSVTLSGRQIVKHMSAQINSIIEGEYDHAGRSIIYNDTDSAIFSAYPALKDEIDSGEIEWSKEACIKLYDTIGEQVNATFPEFMERAFHVPRKNGAIISAGRELVGGYGIFVKKKKYAINMYDKEGKRYDVNGKTGKLKVTGFDIKRSDTPTFIQDELYAILESILNGETKDNIVVRMKDFKLKLREMEPWTKGSPKSVNNLTNHTLTWEKTGKCSVGHVMAAINWNYLRRMNGDKYSMSIMDGMKVIVCKLKKNPLGMTSIAYPTDELRLPDWFKALPFDDEAMELVLFDEKVENMVGILGWNLKQETDINTTFENLFEW